MEGQAASWKICATHLLHDTSLALGKGDVTAGFVLDEFYVDLSTLLAALLIIVVVVVGVRARALGASGRVGAQGPIAVVVVVVVRGRHGRIVVGDFSGHDDGVLRAGTD